MISGFESDTVGGGASSGNGIKTCEGLVAQAGLALALQLSPGSERENPEAAVEGASALQLTPRTESEALVAEVGILSVRQALPLCRRVGNLRGQANCIFNLGNIAFARSQHGDARARFEEALSLYRQAAYVVGEANCAKSLGEIFIQLSSFDEARSRFDSALRLYDRARDARGKS